MKSKKIILGTLLAITVAITGCGSNASQKFQTNETQTELAVSVKNLIIYVQDVSSSLKAIDRYSLSSDGDTITKSYVFDNECKFYDANSNEVSLDKFATVINKSYSADNKMTKCRIVSNDKLVTEAYIVE